MGKLEKQLEDTQLAREETRLKRKINCNKFWLAFDGGFCLYDAVYGINYMAEGRYGYGALILAAGVAMGLFARSDYRQLNRNKEALAELKGARQYTTIDDAVKSEDTEEVLKL